MPKPRIPRELAERPFTLDEGRRAGLTERQLRGRAWKRIGPSTYQRATRAADSLQLLEVAVRRLPPDAVFSGRTAAWLHGLDLSPCDPVEVTLPPHSRVGARAGILVHRAELEGEVIRRHGLQATTILRTLTDLAHALPLVEAVVAADLALHAGAVTLPALAAHAVEISGRRGAPALRRVLELVDERSESQMETRLRLLLVLAGLPRPRTQVDLFGPGGTFIGRTDLYFPAQRLAVEYDGVQHRDRLADDNRRQNRLLAAGFRLLRFTAGDVLGTPGAVVAQVQAALS